MATPQMQTPQLDPGEITKLLHAARAGDGEAAGEVVSRVYQDLKRVARRQMSGEREGHTLQPTAVVHEVFLRLFRPEGSGSGGWVPNALDVQSRAHFLSVAAKQMRRVLVDHARVKKTAKRDFGVKIALEDADPARLSTGKEHPFEELDEQLNLLAVRDPAAAQVVELKFFGGLTDEEVALAMSTSFAQVRRDWEFARAWLRQRLVRT